MIYRTGLGVGDVLLSTGILEALHRLDGRKYIVETLYPELFFNHPGVKVIWKEGKRAKWIRQIFGWPVIWRLGNKVNEWFERQMIKPTYPFPCRGKHLIDAMAETVGVTLLPDERHPFIYLTEAEIKAQSWAKGWIAVQSSSTNYWTVNKHWVPGRMQEVVDALVDGGFKVFHLGSREDEHLLQVIDYRGRTSLREAAAMLCNASLFIGLEGGLVHLARAVETKSVVVYTHYTAPEETGYAENKNIISGDKSEPCWHREKCNVCSEYAAKIDAKMVIDAVTKIININ